MALENQFNLESDLALEEMSHEFELCGNDETVKYETINIDTDSTPGEILDGENIPEELNLLPAVGKERPSHNPTSQTVESGFSRHFDFIRSCLAVVNFVKSHKRHDLVVAISLKLEYIQAMTVGQWENGTYNKTDNPDSSGLVKNTIIGCLMVCAVCDKVIKNGKKVCDDCSAYLRKFSDGGSSDALLSCRHSFFANGTTCRSCRINKFMELSTKTKPLRQQTNSSVGRIKKYRTRRRKTKKRKPRQVGNVSPGVVCPVCEKVSVWFRVWRCSSCCAYQTRLIQRYASGKALPVCEHDGSHTGLGCSGCRFLRIQRLSAIHDPKLATQLPPPTSELSGGND